MFCPKCGEHNADSSNYCKRCGFPLSFAGRITGDEPSTGLEPNVAGVLCYVLGWLTGLIFYLIEKEDRFVRFHAVQSMAVFAPLSVLLIIFQIILWPLALVIGLGTTAIWIALMIKAFQGERFKLPWAGEIAEKYS